MNKVFKESLDKFVIVFIDDILIYTTTKEEHMRYLMMILQILREKNRMLNLRNVNFG